MTVSLAVNVSGMTPDDAQKRDRGGADHQTSRGQRDGVDALAVGGAVADLGRHHEVARGADRGGQPPADADEVDVGVR